MAAENNESKLQADGENNPSITQQPVGSYPQAQYPINPQGTNAPLQASFNQVTMQQPVSAGSIPGLGPTAGQGLGQGGIPGLGSFGTQQQPVQWMMPPPPSPDCHPGLECLKQLDELVVVQQLNVVECKALSLLFTYSDSSWYCHCLSTKLSRS